MRRAGARAPVARGHRVNPNRWPVADAVLAAVLLVMSAAASAQTIPADSTRLVAPPAAAPGRVVSPVPAVTSVLSAEAFLGRVPGGFDYALGAPGRSGGVSFDGLDPARAAVLLDGRPLDDLVTGAARLDLLPLAALGPLSVADGRLGRTAAVEAETRAFRLARPVTELRYLAGQSGVQNVSATHAQTRLPPAFLRGASRDARLTVAGTVLSRAGRGTLVGATLRQTDVLVRALLTRPGARGGLTVDAGLLYTDRTDGARVGVVPGSAASIFSLSARVLEPTATRRTLRTEGYAAATFRLLSAQPATVTGSLVGQRLVFRSDPALAQAGGGDTLRVHARRASLRLAQPFGPRVLFRGGLSADTYPVGAAFGDALGSLRLRADAAVRDSLARGVVAEAGGVVDDGRLIPALALRVARGRLDAGVRLGGSAPGPAEAAGLGARLRGGGGTERTLSADAALAGRRGASLLTLRGYATARWSARLLVARDSAFAVETAPGVLAAMGATLGVSLRPDATRGLYLTTATTAHVALAPDASPLARRDADALPRLRTDVRLGARATGIGDGVLDLDLAVVGRAWTAFRGRVVEPTTGRVALPDPATALGARLPARGTLGVEAAATFSRRATVFLQLDHALGQIVGAAVVQGEPLPVRVVRFGVFWALLD